MKVLLHSNAPFVRTGYGVQCAQLVERLKADGHDPAVSSTYGQQGAVGTWRGTTIYPCGYDQNGNDVLHNHALHHFGGDPLGGWVVPLIDVWSMVNPILADFNVAAWTPIDHFPAPPEVLAFFKRTGATPIAMSRFGERLLGEAGLDPVYIPLAVDTTVLKPSPTIAIGGNEVTGRQMLGVPDDAFVVGMVAMNKGWHKDRKGFNEAFRAFGVFWREHNDAVLYVHADWPGGAEGLNLKELAIHCGIPPHAIVFPDLYAYFPHGFTPEQMAAMYTSFDVLLAPSHGEGFCVPLIEAQACGTPVIATDFSAQTELVGSGWLVDGQPEWDQAQRATYLCPSIVDVVEKLQAAHAVSQDIVERQRYHDRAVAFAGQYDADVVYDTHWRPFLATLEAAPEALEVDRSAGIEPDQIAVVVPAMRRPDNVKPLVDSLKAAGGMPPYFVCDLDDEDEIDAVVSGGGKVIISTRGQTFAQKVNVAYENTTEAWLFICGDDVEFHDGWWQEANKKSDRFDVIGTNDSLPGRVRNPEVANGSHADHFFVRRSYIDTYGACLDGPGVAAPETYRHWYVDREIIGLAKARGVFTPCLDSIVEHHHPGFDGREDLRHADPVYMLAVDASEADARKYANRKPLIEMQRTTRGKQR